MCGEPYAAAMTLFPLASAYALRICVTGSTVVFPSPVPAEILGLFFFISSANALDAAAPAAGAGGAALAGGAFRIPLAASTHRSVQNARGLARVVGSLAS